MSAVYHQPKNREEREMALFAMLSCPTSSIGSFKKEPLLSHIRKSFPQKITDSVFHCGYHSKKSFGATSYFIRRENGNILVDSPRFAGSLVRNLEKLGGIQYMYLTHKDDIAEHEKFKKHFNCERIIHEEEAGSVFGLEISIKGGNPLELAKDLMIIPVPGHTKGHTVLLFKDQHEKRYLFTGDHLCYSWKLKQLVAFRNACWYSWTQQIHSMEKLLGYDFEWVLPGHGRRYHANKDVMKQELEKCIQWMKQ